MDSCLWKASSRTRRSRFTHRSVSFGWKVVAAAFVVALLGWGFGFYGPSLYLAHISAERGWPTSVVAAAITAYYLLGGVLVAWVGDAFNRYGAARVVLAGWAAMAIGVLALTSVGHAVQVFAAFAVMSIGWAAMSGAAVNNIVAPWFSEKRGLAVSWALNGASCGGIIMLPLLVFLTQTLGWRNGLIGALVLATALLAPFAIKYLRPRPPTAPAPASAQAPPKGELRFWTIAVPLARTVVSESGAAFAVALTTFCALAGRIALGAVVDRLDARRTLAALFALQAATLVWLAYLPGLATLYLASAIYGLAVGNVITVPALVVQREFAASLFPRTISLVWSIAQVTFAFGPIVLSILRDRAGNYFAALIFCAGAELLAAIVVLVRGKT